MYRKMSRRDFLKLSAMTAGSVILASCAPKATEVPTAIPGANKEEEPTSPPAKSEKVIVKALLAPGNIVDYLKGNLEAYQKINPDFDVDWNIMEQEQKRTVELQIMSGPDAPDFAWINFGSGLTDKLADAGAIEPLNKYYEKYGWWKFLPDHLHTHEYKGEMYHFSVGSTTTPLMWCNKTLMEEVGLGAPQTLDDLYKWADACRAKGYEPLAMGDRDGWPGFHMYQCIATRTSPLQDYEKILRFDKPENEYYMKDYPGFAEAFQIMRDMETKKVWATGVLDMDDNQAQALLLNKKAVAYETGTWAIANMRQGLGEDLDFFMFPQVHPDIPSPMTASYADEYMMSAKSKYKDQVSDFFNFVLSKDGQKIVAKVGTMPIRVDLIAKDMEGYADPMTGKVAELFGSGKHPVTDEIVTFWPAELYALLRQNGQAAISGQKTPDQIVKEFDDMAADFRAGKA